MNLFALLGILGALIAWALAALMGVNLLSGPFEGRTCQTDCFKMLFYTALALGVISFILGAVSLKKPRGRIFSWLALLLSVGIIGVFGMLFVAGNFF